MIVVLSTRPFELTLSEIGQQTTQTMEVYCAQSCKLSNGTPFISDIKGHVALFPVSNYFNLQAQ